MKMTRHAPQHDRDVTHHLLHHWLGYPVHTVARPHRDLPLVGPTPLPGLGGEDALVDGPHGARHHAGPGNADI